MRSMAAIIGGLFSGGIVRLASIGIAVYVGSTIGGEVIANLQSISEALQIVNN